MPVVDECDFVLRDVVGESLAYLCGSIGILSEEIPHFRLPGLAQALLLKDQVTVVSH